MPEPSRTRRRNWLLAVAPTLLAVYLLYVWTWRPLALEGEPLHDGFVRVAGVVHVHTTLSDGGGTPEEVVEAARSAGLDFLVLTDHNNLDAKGVEGRHEGLTVLVGTEISTGGGHLLGFGIPDPTFRFSGDLEDALEDVRALEGVAFAAHPTSPVPAFRWTGWDQPGAWGMELLNGDSQWREAGWGRLIRTAGLYLLNPRYALLTSLTPPEEALVRWEAQLQRRHVPGVAGADAHSRVRIRRQTAIRFPSYQALFELARNHVLLERAPTGDLARDRDALLGALARGRSYVSVDALAPADGFGFVAEREGRRWTMGDTVPAGEPLALKAGGRLPAGATLTLLRDGRIVSRSERRIEVTTQEPGVYRVEVRVRGWEVPWVLSNPIYVFDDEAAARRAAEAQVPPRLPAPPAASVLDGFEGTTAFAAEFDPSSEMRPGVLEPGAGSGGGGAGRLAFRLGAPSANQPYTWCALVDRRARDLSGHAGLVFSIKADGVYRLWIQVRDENPASADEGTEWWFASVRTSRHWQRVAVPFARLRSLNEATDGRLDLDEVRGIAFILDGGAVKVGTRGTVWIDDLGVYDPERPELRPGS